MKYKDVYNDYKIRKNGYCPTIEELRFLDSLSGELYEIGIDFGDRVLYLLDREANIKGGCEFNPLFPAYGHKLSQLYSKDLAIDSLDINHIKFHNKYETMFSYKFLDRSSEILKSIIEQSCDRYIAYEECLGGFYDSANRT